MEKEKELNPDLVVFHAAASEQHRLINVALASISAARSLLRLSQQKTTEMIKASQKLKDKNFYSLAKDREKIVVKTLSETTAIVQRLASGNLTPMLEYGYYLSKINEKCASSGNLTEIAYILDLYNNGALKPILDQAKQLLEEERKKHEESIQEEVLSTGDTPEVLQVNAGSGDVTEQGTESHNDPVDAGITGDTGHVAEVREDIG